MLQRQKGEMGSGARHSLVELLNVKAGLNEWVADPIHRGCPKIGSLRWWPGAGIRFSLGLLWPDQTQRGGDYKKLDAGKVTGQGSLTQPRVQSLPWRAAGGPPCPFPPGQMPRAPAHRAPALRSSGRGTLALGQAGGRPPAARQVLIERRGPQKAGAGASGYGAQAARARPYPSPRGGERPAAAARTCGSPRRALPRQLQPPPGVREPRPGRPEPEQRWAATRTASARWTVTTRRRRGLLVLNRPHAGYNFPVPVDQGDQGYLFPR